MQLPLIKDLELMEKLIKGAGIFGSLREEDIQVGVTPKEAIYQEDKVTLYRFAPQIEHAPSIPVLIVYALVNRPYIVDLQDERSLVANLLKLGLDVYLIDWGNPSRADRWLTIEDYINGYLNNCVDFLRDRLNANQINLLGICQGGTFSLCYSALYPQKVKTLIAMVTPVDFHVREGLLNLWAGCTLNTPAFDVDLMVDTLGNIPGEFLNLEFLMLKPFQLGVEKYIKLAEIVDNQDKILNFLRMEKWIFDSPDHPGEVYRQFIKDFYQDNKLIQGLIDIGGRRVNLQDIRIPVLNIYAQQDHLVPPQSSMALKQYIGSEDYTERSFPTGHIGMYVSSKVQRDLPPAIANWLKARVIAKG